MGQRYAFLDYDGLQRYDQDWLDEFERMKIKDWEIENMFDDVFPFEKEIFRFTGKIDISTTNTSKIGIPFNLYKSNENTKLIVDWGDGIISQLTASDYSDYYDYEVSVHKYTSSGLYNITIKCNNWEDINLLDRKKEYDIRYNTFTVNFSYFSENVYSLPVALPKTRTKLISVANWFNQYNSNLTYITSDFFKNYPDISNFNGCFYDCSSLTSIPADLFKYNVNATNFTSCFYNCTSLQSIPSGLFDNNTAVTTFKNCFRKCTSLQSIPSGLFDNNTAVTDFQYCFYGCSSLGNFTLHIGSPIVTSVEDFIQNKSNTTRIIYVPNNSKTKTSFEKYIDSFGITVIGE